MEGVGNGPLGSGCTGFGYWGVCEVAGVYVCGEITKHDIGRKRCVNRGCIFLVVVFLDSFFVEWWGLLLPG